MLTNDILISPAYRTAMLRRYIAEAFITLMKQVNGAPVYIESGECVELTTDKVALNIIFHIEAPWIDEFGEDEGCRLATETLEQMLSPGFAGEVLRLSAKGVTELREVYRDIIFGAPDGELPQGYTFMSPDGGEGFL